MKYVSYNPYDYIYKKQEQEEDKNMFGFIVGLILGGIIGFVGCLVLVIANLVTTHTIIFIKNKNKKIKDITPNPPGE